MNQAKPSRVLVVEDEMMIAMLISDMLEELGYTVVGPMMRLDRALKAAEEETFDFALLDINLADQQSFPVADVLRRRGIPFIFATGYGSKGLSVEYKEAMTLQKPFEIKDLSNAMSQQMDGQA